MVTASTMVPHLKTNNHNRRAVYDLTIIIAKNFRAACRMKATVTLGGTHVMYLCLVAYSGSLSRLHKQLSHDCTCKKHDVYYTSIIKISTAS